jgi:DNA (cytosine-5)-methyltransferase 1
MTHGSLFSGIGGFDLAAEWMGWENKFHCEWNPFGQKVLHHYFPNAEQFTDITKSDFTKYANKIDILTGGFPCQPYSSAGKRLGKEDDRHLFPEMLRAIREIQPRWVVGENVLGLVNWNGGLVFNEVQTDLETEGYEVQPYILPALSVNAPHRRDRVWFVAYSKRTRLEHWNETRNLSSEERKTSKKGSKSSNEFKTDGNGERNAADTNSRGLEGSTEVGWDSEYAIGKDGTTAQTRNVANSDGIGLWGQSNGIRESRFIGKDSKRSDWENFPTVSPIRNGNDGISDRLDSITFPKWRTESIKAGGNAVVPQVVYQIFKAIEQYENLNAWTSQ